MARAPPLESPDQEGVKRSGQGSPDGLRRRSQLETREEQESKHKLWVPGISCRLRDSQWVMR